MLSKLPHDIFKMIMRHTYVYTLGPLRRAAELDIEVLSPPIPASQVCRSWRRALLSDPTMWTCFSIPDMSPEWITELLRRSGSSLLNVFLIIKRNNNALGTRYDEISSAVFTLLRQIHRIKLLRVQICVWSPQDSVEALCQQTLSYLHRPAPVLEMLSFDYYAPHDLQHSSSDYGVIKKLFAGDAPNLRRIHHRLSCDLRELDCPLFHGLSELRLSMEFNLNFTLFLDLLESSPNLKLLRLDVSPFTVSVFERPSGHKVSLPFLEQLVLEAAFLDELKNLFLTHLIFPLSVRWRIASVFQLWDTEESPSVIQFLSRAHFTSLRLITFDDFAQLISEEKSDMDHDNQFVYYYEYMACLIETWDQVMDTLKSSFNITHLDLELGDGSGKDYDNMFPKLFTSMSSLQSLMIRPSISSCRDNGADVIRVQCLAALTPTGVEGFPTHNSYPFTSAVTLPVILCPLLREVTLELLDPSGIEHARILRACSDLRRKAGYPFQMHVRWPQMKRDVEEALGLRKDDSIKITVFLPHAFLP